MLTIQDSFVSDLIDETKYNWSVKEKGEEEGCLTDEFGNPLCVADGDPVYYDPPDECYDYYCADDYASGGGEYYGIIEDPYSAGIEPLEGSLPEIGDLSGIDGDLTPSSYYDVDPMVYYGDLSNLMSRAYYGGYYGGDEYGGDEYGGYYEG